MLDKLREDPDKIPSPSRDDLMRMTIESLDEINVNCEQAFKNLGVTNALDGSEDHLISDRIYQLVGPNIISFRKKLLQEELPKSFDDLLKSITPPKGIRRKNFEG